MNLCCVPLAKIRLCLPEFPRLHSCGFVRARGITVWDAWEAEASRTRKVTAADQAVVHVCCHRSLGSRLTLPAWWQTALLPGPPLGFAGPGWGAQLAPWQAWQLLLFAEGGLEVIRPMQFLLCFQPSQAPDSTASFTFHPVLVPKCLLFPVQTPAPQALVKIIQNVVAIRSTVGILWIQLFISPYSEGYSLRVRIKDYKEFQPLYAICVKNIVEDIQEALDFEVKLFM